MNKRFLFSIVCLPFFQLLSGQTRDQGSVSSCGTYSIDVVIPAHEKDIRTLEMAIEGIRTYGKNVRRVVVVSAKQLTVNAEWFDEAHYPFSKKEVLDFIRNNVLKNDRTEVPRLGWIYQQLLKLYAPITIPDLSPNVLILDADTIFLRPVDFIDCQGNALYDVADQYHTPYFEHAKKLIKDKPITRVFAEYSGIANHMLMRREVIHDLFESIIKTHCLEPWKAILSCIDPAELKLSCISEYEIYFNFVFARKDDVKIRPLRFTQFGFDRNRIKQHKDWGFDYVSCHTWFG